ncbi:MAG: methionine-gamma-lyase [Cyclobacteriaceae bacterium]|jgi:methionine-gamma-lyase
MQPESLMMSHGYNPSWSQGAIKCPIFQTSTFVFETAEEGKAFFEVAYGLRDQAPNEKLGLIYSRLNNPDLEILEGRLALWDKADDCAVFESGMSAISSVFFEFLSPGDVLLHSGPLYGGTLHFINHILKRFGIDSVSFDAMTDPVELSRKLKKEGKRVGLIYIESPANPTNQLIDIEAYKQVANELTTDEKQVLVVVDNTYMGPLWCHPLAHGADLVIYSATKYIGGHSDVIAGACLGNKELLARLKAFRTFAGNMAGPWTAWLLMRSLETLKIRMEKQAENATIIAQRLANHPKVARVFYLGLLDKEDPQYAIYHRQYSSPGAMLAFNVKGDEPEAFQFLNSTELIKLAVSLGSTESLGEHPATMTHADVSAEDKLRLHIGSSLVRLSIGVENVEDLWYDIDQALNHISD